MLSAFSLQTNNLVIEARLVISARERFLFRRICLACVATGWQVAQWSSL